MKKYLSNYIPGLVLFFLALLVGLVNYKDYGVGWDEPIQRTLAKMNYDYVTHVNRTLVADVNRFYGMGFELPLFYLEKLLRLTDTRDIYLMRHIVCHIFFLTGALFFYVLVFRLFRSRFLACIGFLALVLSPRLYAHSYFNSKDIPFLSVIIITLLVSQIAFEKNKTALFLLAGVLCGYLTSIRILGVMPGGIILLFLMADLMFSLRGKDRAFKSLINILVYLSGFCLMLYIAWPVLWEKPLSNFIQGYQTMAHYNNWGGHVLFKGARIAGDHLPWTYFPTWFLITNPIFWLFAGFAGMIIYAVSFLKKPLQALKNTPGRNFLFYLLLFFIPVVAVIALHSVIYDDWRHLYFVYPGFILIALYFINETQRYRYGLIVTLGSIIQLGFTGYFMVGSHPFQQVYFNSLVSHKKDYLLRNYDLEYWGCAYKQALEYLVATDKSAAINISWSMNPVPNNIMFLPPADRARVHMVEDSANYTIANFRGVPDRYYDSVKAVYSIRVLNSPIVLVYKVQ